MNKLISLIIFLFPLLSWAQNLVPNSSFEQYINCPDGPAQIYYVEPWYSAWGTVNYYNSCSIGNFNVPNAQGGGGEANSGAAYAGIAVYASMSGFENAREFIEVELVSQLISGEKYKVEFYVSLMDSAWHATSSLSACFTANGIGNNLDNIFSLTPQIQNPDTFFLAEKDKWMKVENSFYATGTERFIAIGNFKNDENTDTLNVYQGQPGWRQASYYLDDVSVTLDTTTGINEEELPEIEFALYPNPNDGNMYLEYQNLPEQATFIMYDIIGRQVAKYYLRGENGKLNITENILGKGNYIYRILSENTKYKTGKIIISK